MRWSVDGHIGCHSISRTRFTGHLRGNSIFHELMAYLDDSNKCFIDNFVKEFIK